MGLSKKELVSIKQEIVQETINESAEELSKIMSNMLDKVFERINSSFPNEPRPIAEFRYDGKNFYTDRSAFDLLAVRASIMSIRRVSILREEDLRKSLLLVKEYFGPKAAEWVLRCFGCANLRLFIGHAPDQWGYCIDICAELFKAAADAQAAAEAVAGLGEE